MPNKKICAGRSRSHAQLNSVWMLSESGKSLRNSELRSNAICAVQVGMSESGEGQLNAEEERR